MKLVVVLGAGESGVGAALLAKSKGYDVFVSDGSKIAEQYKNELIGHAIDFEESMHSLDRLKQADILVKSPGIPDHIDLIKKLKAFGLDPISEIEFASQYCEGVIVGITGSNGKTTTTGLTHHLISGSQFSVELGGNYGISLARLLYEKPPVDVYVLELSSFQLDGIKTFRPDVAMILNITPDHLDRYEYDFEKYASAKMRIAMNLSRGDLLIINSDQVDRIDPELEAEFQCVDMEQSAEAIYDLDMLEFYEYRNIALQGKHNTFNTQCAVWAAEWIGVDTTFIEQRLSDFKNLPHRMELVETIGGVSFINDSKATNVDATAFALDAMTDETIWIAGGTDKGNDYESIAQLVKSKVKALICLGVDNKAIRLSFADKLPVIIETQDINEAVSEAFRLAEGNGTVLLSPACASFDLFRNYEDRGDQFKEAVMALKVK